MQVFVDLHYLSPTSTDELGRVVEAAMSPNTLSTLLLRNPLFPERLSELSCAKLGDFLPRGLRPRGF